MVDSLDRWIRTGRLRAQLGSQAHHQSPAVVILGGLHGNESGGLDAAHRVLERLADQGSQWPGELFIVAGNLGALRKGRRFLDRDLNRGWSEARVARLSRLTAYEKSREDKEFLELVGLFKALEERCPKGLVLFDLHTTSGAAPPFSVITDQASNHGLARALSMPTVLGFDRYVDEPILTYFERHGWPAIGIEGGRQGTTDAVHFLEEAVVRLLVSLGWPIEGYDNTGGVDDRYAIRYRHAVVPGSGFVMEPGFTSFDPVKRGQLLAHDRTGAVRSAIDGLVFLPLYQRQGTDGFFLLESLDSDSTASA